MCLNIETTMRKIPFLIFILSIQLGYSQSLRALYQEGVKAYEANNYELFRDKMEQINNMRPNYPAVVYNLAGGYSLTGSNEMALKTLNQYILMDAITDFTQDSDFKSLIGETQFEKLLKKRELLSSPIKVDQAYSFPVLYAHPESITYSQDQKSFFIGGVRDGAIWKVQPNEEPILWAKSEKNSWSVMGLQVSQDEKFLWACTAAMSNYQNFEQHEEGYASVLQYSLSSGELLQTYALPGGHNFGDLIVDRKGNVFISDGVANKLYWVEARSKKLEEFYDLSDEVFNLQGLTFGEKENEIFLSDYIDGIYKLDLKDKSLIKLDVKSDKILIKGIDGLYYRDGSLIGLHNGTKPNRIVKYFLSEDRSSILSKKVVSQADILGEPTQGVWIQEKFYYISNSPWASYDPDGNFTPSEKNLIIGVIE